MPEFSKAHAKLLADYVRRFHESFEEEVVAVLRAQFRGCTPVEIREVLEELSLLERQLQVRTQKAKVHDAHSRLLKRILIDERRHTAEAIDEPLQKAVDRGVIHQLMRETNKLEQFMEQPWFDSVEAMRLPKLTDYLSVRYAEESMEELYMEPRELDEKFHILEAPSLFLRDLAYYRIRCGLRDLPIAVAYMDIDDFKAFNTKYTETKVDLDLLTPFMETIEAHVFAHGHAYRFGGGRISPAPAQCGVGRRAGEPRAPPRSRERPRMQRDPRAGDHLLRGGDGGERLHPHRPRGARQGEPRQEPREDRRERLHRLFRRPAPSPRGSEDHTPIVALTTARPGYPAASWPICSRSPPASSTRTSTKAPSPSTASTSS
ncbi:MAG: hypothetical protein R3B72_49130 [Polyangiaceae bacterium]